jgi:hypothetical protein
LFTLTSSNNVGTLSTGAAGATGATNGAAFVPEPSVLSILAVGLAGLGFTLRGRKMRG